MAVSENVCPGTRDGDAGYVAHHNIVTDHARVHFGNIHNYEGKPLAYHEVAAYVRGGQMSVEEWDLHEYDRRRKERHHSTGDWFFSDSAFKDWIADGCENPLLWITAPSGCGKSVLCSAAMDHVSTLPATSATALIHFAYDNPRKQLHMLRSLACQLLAYVMESSSLDDQALKRLRGPLRTDRELGALIRQLVALCPRVFVFLDGLDEAVDTNPEIRDQTRQDLDSFITFLRELVETPTADMKTRLWCSSQRHDIIEQWLTGFKQYELCESSVKEDVQIFLQSMLIRAMNGSDQVFEREAIDSMLHAAAGANFRWAAMMRHSLEGCLKNVDVVKRVFWGLPKDLRKIYQKHLKRMQDLDEEDVEEDLSGLGTSLSSHILSVVTFAKRRLKLSEVQEALSILCPRPSFNDLRRGDFIAREDIISRCRPLVEYRGSGDADDGFLQLSHESVARFLIDHWHSEESEESVEGTNTFVDPRVLGSACLSYLQQARYRHMLSKESPNSFRTVSGPEPRAIADHKFLQYAVKFWYRHADDYTPLTTKFRTSVTRFMTSPQFVTTIQIQSLFLFGHFSQNLQGWENLVMENLPRWLAKDSESPEYAMYWAYYDFVAEWGRFLQQGVTNQLNGEIDRCLWGALGEQSFLHHNRIMERHTSFRLSTPRATSTDRPCVYETINADGTKIFLWRLLEVEDNTTSRRLQREAWHIDGSQEPYLYETEKLVFDNLTTSWSAYDPCRSRVFPLIPCEESQELPSPIEHIHDNHTVRIGAGEYVRSNGIWMARKSDGIAQSLFWENIQKRSPYLMRSRRRLMRTSLDRSSFDSCQSEAGDNKDRRFSISSSDSLQLDSDLNTESEKPSSGQEYLSASGSDDIDTSVASPESADDRSTLGSGVDSNHGGDPMSSSEDRTFEDSGPQATPGSTLSSSDSDKVAEQHGYDSGDSNASALPYQPHISGTGGHPYVLCDTCDDDHSTHFYRCRRCNPQGAFDICASCFRDGQWCKQMSHQLWEFQFNARRGYCIRKRIHTADSVIPMGCVKVYRYDQAGTRPIFQYNFNSTTRLHDSPGLLHSKHPLCIYPLDGENFLFANIEMNTYFVLKVGVVPNMAVVSIQMVVARTSNLVHVARFYGQMDTDDIQQIWCETFSLRLSSDNAASGRPQYLPGNCVLIYRRRNTMISSLPFTVTWTSSDAYITCSAEHLRVFRFSLPQDNYSISPTKVRIPSKSEGIILPRSALRRPVRFYPPKTPNGNSVLIMGCRYDEISNRPIVVYLSTNALGEWKTLDKADQEFSCDHKTRIRSDAHFEAFDSTDDCRPIRYRPEHERHMVG